MAKTTLFDWKNKKYAYKDCDGIPYGCERYTKKIVDNLLKQVIDSFWIFI